MDYPQDACFEVRAALPLFVGEDLEREELAAVEAHLASCPACEELHARARSARQVLTECRAAADAAPAPDLWDGVRVALRDEGILAPAGPRPLETPAPIRRPRLLPVGLVSAAAAVVCAFLLASAFEGGATTTTSPLAFSPTEGGVPTDATPVRHQTRGRLRYVGEEGDAMYPRARELRAEQGLVAPTSATEQPSLVQPAGLRRDR